MAEVLAVQDEYRVQTLAMLLQECKASGMSTKFYCEQCGVSERSSYYRCCV